MLARLARLVAAALLIAGWQAALDHPVGHAVGAHEETALCAVLDALCACVARASIALAGAPAICYFLCLPSTAWRAADAPPFLSHGPPATG